jgi:hypothetical protein
MPMSRRAAGTEEMSLPSTRTAPVSAVSKPATMRRAVVLPQPEGPSSATSSPGAISIESPSSARVVPNARLRLCSTTLVPPATCLSPFFAVVCLVPAAAPSLAVLVVMRPPSFLDVRR